MASPSQEMSALAAKFDTDGSLHPDVKPAIDDSSRSSNTVQGAQESITAKAQPNDPIQINDLFGSAETPHPDSPPRGNSISGNQPEEIKMMFLHEYGRGIDYLLETDWYSRNGVVQLMRDARLRSALAGLLDIMRNTKQNDYEAVQKIPHMEAKVTWRLMCMSRAVHELIKGDPIPPNAQDPQLQEVLYRLQVVEALVCNRILAPGTVWPAVDINVAPDRARQVQFWRLMGGMLALPHTSRIHIDGYLSEIRKILDLRENRDVLYSIAVVRHIGLAPPPLPKTVAEAAKHTRDIRDQKIAKKFIEDEAAHKGTTQVMQRLCAMVVRSWAIQGYALVLLPFSRCSRMMSKGSSG